MNQLLKTRTPGPDPVRRHSRRRRTLAALAALSLASIALVGSTTSASAARAFAAVVPVDPIAPISCGCPCGSDPLPAWLSPTGMPVCSHSARSASSAPE